MQIMHQDARSCLKKQLPQVELELGLHELRQWHGEESNMWTQQLDPENLQCAPLEYIICFYILFS